MLLNKLRQYHDERMENQPSLYASTPVAWIVEIDSEGRPLSSQPTSRIDDRTARGRRGLDMTAPEVQRSSNILPFPLADTGEYTFGRPRKGRTAKRAVQQHLEYRRRLQECAEHAGEPAVDAVLRFFKRGGASLLDLGDDWDYEQKVTFRVHIGGGAVLPIDLPEVQRFWRLWWEREHTKLLGHCHLCGLRKPLVRILPQKLKGIRGGHTSGTLFITANEGAFESYGLKQSHVAPTCVDCAEAFSRAMNDLLKRPDGHYYAGRDTFIFWTRERVDFNLASLMQDPDPAQLREFLDSPDRGSRVPTVDESSFYAARLSPRAKTPRVVVRDWIDTTVGDVKRNVRQWFDLQRIVGPLGEDPTPYGLIDLAASTVGWKAGRPASDDIAATAHGALLRAALLSESVPDSLSYRAVRRCVAEQGFPLAPRPRQKYEERLRLVGARAALMKLVLLKRESTGTKENYMVALESEHPEPAYQCGRLLAVLEQVQREAMPRVNTTVVDRFFGSASSAPVSAFARLWRGAQPHLATLRKRDNKAAYFALQRRLEEVYDRIGEFPKSLSLEQQALFSLGYYHQRAHDRAEAMSRRAARDGANANDDAAKE
ncbi:MAG: type I-C CRISPR-associated protein Cas8c/Csd1 [Chloroflexi bacterium]|nr:type I-C CRISPR-associated protein Cas8c/Csd1 [Chloroflexota bacterium]